MSGYVQPVKVFGPKETRITGVSSSGYAQSYEGSLLVGLPVGSVHAFEVIGVPNQPEAQVFATVELIDRLYPPCGKELKFPVPIELTEEELKLAANNAFITRVIYVENPNLALPIDEKQFTKTGGQQWFEARQGDDPLVVADVLGRPIAILRIGSRRPSLPGGGSAPMIIYNTGDRQSVVSGQ